MWATHSLTSHVQLEWELLGPIFSPIRACRKLIRFDHRVSGLSDRGVEDLSLDAFAQSGQVRTVESKVLSKPVLWAADNAEVPADNELVVYQASELKALIGMPPDRLRKMHAIKKMFDGEVLPMEQQ